MDNSEHNLIHLQIEKEITNLFKSYLELLSQIDTDNKIMLDKVDKYTSEKFSDNINFLTKEKHDAIRKIILDRGNDSIRNILGFLDLFDFQINPDKLKEAINKPRTVTKKIVIGGVVDYNK